MATKQTWDIQFKRLIRKWGEKPFSGETPDFIWRSVRDLPDEKLIQVVEMFLMKNRWAPTPDDFYKAIADLRIEKKPDPRKEKSMEHRKISAEDFRSGMKVLSAVLDQAIDPEKLDNWIKSSKANQKCCKFCDGHGLIFAKEKGTTNEDFVFKCVCPEGKQLDESYPTWASNCLEKYEICI